MVYNFGEVTKKQIKFVLFISFPLVETRVVMQTCHQFLTER